MALKRRSMSTISTISNITEKNNINNYRHLTDLSPDVEIRSIDVPKKQRLFLKKTNLNFIRKKKGELKTSTSLSNLCDEKIFRESSDTVERPLSDPGDVSKNPNKTGKNYFLYGSFSFGQDRYSKPGIYRKNQSPKFAYRFLIHGSDWTTGTDWSLIGCSEIVSLSAEENNSQFSFVTPFQVKYEYDADTTLRLELQRTRLSEKSFTIGIYNSPGINSIDKGKKWKSETSEVTGNSKFVTIASLSCDLNGLVNRGFLNSPMIMKSDLSPECSIYLGAEPEETNPAKYSNLKVNFSAKQRFDENNVRLFSTDNGFRLLISKFFDRAQAFVPIFKSYIFGLSQKNLNYQAEIDLMLTQQQFSKIDTIYRFALIEANSEKCLCFGDFRGSDFTAQDFEVPITEANFTQSLEMRNDQGFFQTITPGIGFFRLRRNSDSKPEIIDFMPLADTSYTSHPGSFSRTSSVNEKNLNSARLSRMGSGRDSQRSSKIASIVSDSDVDMKEDEEDTVIVNGHTQAYLMSLLLPNKKILVREIFPDHENICEFRR